MSGDEIAVHTHVGLKVTGFGIDAAAALEHVFDQERHRLAPKPNSDLSPMRAAGSLTPKRAGSVKMSRVTCPGEWPLSGIPSPFRKRPLLAGSGRRSGTQISFGPHVRGRRELTSGV